MTNKEIVNLETISDEVRLFPALLAMKYLPFKYQRPEHIRFFEDLIIKLTDEDNLRYIIEVPPRHGKSISFSVLLPTFYILNHLNRKILLASYGYTLAGQFAFKVRNLLANTGIVTFTKEMVNDFETEQEGGLFSAGVGGSITGKGASLLILDDPTKNMEEARSKNIRDKTYEWFNSTFLTRAEPNANVVVIQTRWHSDDLAGRLLSEKKEKWIEIKFPAFAEENDFLNREIGEPLWPERFSKEELEEKKVAMGSYVWNALYQQNPIASEASIFKTSMFKYYEFKDGMYYLENKAFRDFDFIFGTADLALKKEEMNDYTAIGIWGIKGNAILLIHRIKERLQAGEILETFRSLYQKYLTNVFYVESFGFQLSFVQQLIDKNIPVEPSYLKGDKYAKALAIIPFFEAGRVYFNREADYLDDLEKELLSFPNGEHDDQVDMTSLAVTGLSIPREAQTKPKGW